MKYDDLEKTRDLFDIPDGEVPSPIDDLDMEGVSKEEITPEDFTLGLSGDDAVEPQREEVDTKKNKKKTKKKREPLSKKKKIIIALSILLVLLIIGLVLFFVFKDDGEKKREEPKKPEVIVEKDNYIYRDGTLVFLNSNDEEIGTYECANKDEELCYVSFYSTEDKFDGEKNVYEDETLIERVSIIYQDNYVFVYDNESDTDNNIILYDIKKGEEIGKYNLVKGFSDSNFVIVRDEDNRYGALEFSSDGVKEVFAFSYDYLGRMSSSSNVVVKTNDRYYIYSVSGENKSSGLRYEVMSYNDKYVVVNNNGYYVYSYSGDLIFDDAYDYIELLDNYAILMDRDILYVRDYQDNVYNIEGIDLGSTYYNPLHIYNKDKVYIETRRAYEITINDNEMDVTFTLNNKDRTETIDLQDGKISAKYQYISYFDGILYFYADEDKSDLLGSYECSNANQSDLTNCTIATDSFYSDNDLEEDKSDSLGWVPIYNKRYVFILDTIDLNNPTIVLYDLKAKKALARYTSVDSGAYTGKREVTFVDTDASYVMAQVKSDGDYGLLRITDNVAGAIGFDYDSIEKFGEYYLVSTSSGTYMLYASSGGTKPLTAAYGYPIVDYSGTYVKVNNNGKYRVYDFLGSRLWEDEGEYLYVDLDANYYVVIDSNNELNIHKYDDPEFTLDIKVALGSGSDYATLYTISEVNGGYSITVTSTNTTYTYDSNGLRQS